MRGRLKHWVLDGGQRLPDLMELIAKGLVHREFGLFLLQSIPQPVGGGSWVCVSPLKTLCPWRSRFQKVAGSFESHLRATSSNLASTSDKHIIVPFLMTCFSMDPKLRDDRCKLSTEPSKWDRSLSNDNDLMMGWFFVSREWRPPWAVRNTSDTKAGNLKKNINFTMIQVFLFPFILAFKGICISRRSKIKIL